MEKIKVVIAGCGIATREFIISNQDNKYIDIVGIIIDPSISEIDRKNFLYELNTEINKEIKEFSFFQNDFSQVDIVFLTEYRRIIPRDITEQYFIVNCHGGILPKWRGFSANAWAIMNGENEIGFTIHRVRTGLDDGEIYYTNRMSIDSSQTYADLHDEMINRIVREVPSVLYEIAKGINMGVKQPSHGFAYCNKFSKSMGDISGFTENSNYYVNLWRCMAKPLGSGLWFKYNDKKYEVNKIEHGKTYGIIDYIGVPGKVVNVEDDKLWVKSKDNAIILSDICLNGEKIIASEHFKNGSKIG